MSLQDIKVCRDELEQVEVELASVELSLQELLERQNELTQRRSELKLIIKQDQSNQKQQKDTKFWDKTDFLWTRQIDEKLQSVFGLKVLRPMQRQTMNATLSGEDCLLIMPTGGGKSLCFQLPAVISQGLTLVVSPLVSLMEDQQMALEQLNLSSAILTASSTKEMQKFVLDDMVKPNGSLKMLYVTPEKLAKSKRFMNKLEKCYSIGHLSRLVIDEVHCCSQWGHDFRPDYKFLGIMKRQYPNTPILGLTATATTKVLEDVKKILNIPAALVLKASFNRPNLFYEVREKPSSQKDTIDAILSLIKGKFKDQSGIVYCFSRKESEEVTMQLLSRGVEAGCYHADINAKSRSQVHRRWLDGELQVVVATVAFGMGIDKPDVRFVIHHSISKSMENLYQESGRAGRDGKRSDCIVFYRLADMARQSCMVFTEQTGLPNLHGIVKYCTDVSSCRRSIIANHFGEVWDGAQCAHMCDHCDRKNQGGGFEKRDVTRHCEDVLAILDMASSTEQRVTALKVIDAWYGRGGAGLKVKSVKPPSISRSTAERILTHMIMGGYVTEDFHFTAYSTICYLVQGSKAKLIWNKVARVCLDFPITNSSKSNLSSSTVSSSSSSTCTNASSSTKNGKKFSEKPKLVVVNKEKSHFHSWNLDLSSASSSKVESSSSSHSSILNSKSKILDICNKGGKKTELKNKEDDSIVLSDSGEELNFDDDDDFVSQAAVKSYKKGNSVCSDSQAASTTGCEKVNAKNHLDGSMRKLRISSRSHKSETQDELKQSENGSFDSESDEEIVKRKATKRRKVMISDDSDVEEKDTIVSPVKSSKLCLKKRTKCNNSILISDEENAIEDVD